MDKAIGNIKNSHKAIFFIGVVESNGKTASLLHYQFGTSGRASTAMNNSSNAQVK